MKSIYDQQARKRPFKLTLYEDLAPQARTMINNFSGVVESLLKDFVERKRQQRLDEAQALKATIAIWNDFDSKVGSFADEHSTF